MENKTIKGTEGYQYSYGIPNSWSILCSNKKFQLNNNGIKLRMIREENLEKIIFDVDKKTIEVKVKNPILSSSMPRVANISDCPEFFNDLRNNIETILLTGTYSSVKPNKDRTVFEVE